MQCRDLNTPSLMPSRLPPIRTASPEQCTKLFLPTNNLQKTLTFKCTQALRGCSLRAGLLHSREHFSDKLSACQLILSPPRYANKHLLILSVSTVHPQASTGTNSLQKMVHTHRGTVDMKVACSAFTRSQVQKLFKNDTISRAHSFPWPLPTLSASL